MDIGPEQPWPGLAMYIVQYTLSAHAFGPVHSGPGQTRSGPANPGLLPLEIQGS